LTKIKIEKYSRREFVVAAKDLEEEWYSVYFAG